MATVLHIAEPTLRDHAGHCASLVRSLIGAGGASFHVWLARGATVRFEGAAHHAAFGGTLRRVRAVLAARNLLALAARGERVLFSTATTADMLALDLASRLPGVGPVVVPGRVWLFVHWLNPSPRKSRLLAKLASRHPGLEVACSTRAVHEALTHAGFPRARFVPYPGADAPCDTGPGPFRHVLYAGAARLDKGFAAVVALAEHLAHHNDSTPMTVQCSPPHRGTHSPEVAPLVARLHAIARPSIRLAPDTLDAATYAALFDGAVVIQPYDPRAFADRISGVTLDALRHGCPVIVPRGTWMARLIEPHRAGVVLDDPRDPAALADAVRLVREGWPGYAASARAAGEAIAREGGAAALLDAVLGRA